MTLAEDGKLKRDSFIYQVAYMFTPSYKKPEVVDRCTLVTRFLVRLIPWAILSALVWVVLGIICGVIGQLLCRLWLFVCEGRKLVYYAQGGINLGWLPARNALSTLTVFTYEREDIDWLDWADLNGGPRSPILVVITALFALVIALAILYCLFYFVPVYLVPWVWGTAFVPAAHLAYDSLSWWGKPLVGLLLIVAAFFAVRHGYRRLGSSQTGSVLINHFKEWKAQHCPVYRVV